jgi:hypothetical protein
MAFDLDTLVTLYTYQDGIELLASIIVTHYSIKRILTLYGTQNYLIFCGFSAAFLGTLFLQLPILSTLICLAATVTFFTHSSPPNMREQRQTSFIPAAAPLERSWQEHIMPLSIQAAHEQISFIWIIEHNLSLQDSITTDIPLQIYISAKLNTFLLPLLYSHKTGVLWVNHNGYLLSINPCLITTKTIPPLPQIIALSNSHDALVIQTHPTAKTYSLWYRGTHREHISSHHMHRIIQQIFSNSPAPGCKELR